MPLDKNNSKRRTKAWPITRTWGLGDMTNLKKKTTRKIYSTLEVKDGGVRLSNSQSLLRLDTKRKRPSGQVAYTKLLRGMA